MNKYTPGPWELRGPRTITDQHGAELAEAKPVNQTGIGDCRDETAANTRLIAAAPELLEALENLLTSTIDQRNGYRDRDLHESWAGTERRARRSIAKARRG